MKKRLRYSVHLSIYCQFGILGLLLFLVSCQENTSQQNTENETFKTSPFEEFTNKFVLADSVPPSLNNDNATEWYNDENTITDTLFLSFLKDKTFQGFKGETGTFAIDDEHVSFQYSGRIPLSEKYHSFLVSTASNSPTHKWKIYLVNYSLAGDYRDAILLCYRDSYISTRQNYTIRTGEYRTAELLEGQRLKITDVVYDNRVDNPSITDPEEKPIDDSRYKMETAYQIRFDGTFNILRQEQKPQENATPE